MKASIAALIAACTLLAAASAATAEPLTVPFTLSKPAGDGPFPAVVILHDCSGLGPGSSGAPWRWSSQLTRLGYVTIWPDSFATREHPRGVCTDSAPPRVTYKQRAGDAYAALDMLRTLPFVDAKRVAVMGGSHGGSSTLATIVEGANPGAGPGFRAAIALYPGCGISVSGWKTLRAGGPYTPITGYEGIFKPSAPLLILSGELDDWTPAEPCRKLAETARAGGYPVDIKVYPGAHHSFDSAAPVSFIAERTNSNSRTGRGATTGGNAAAWKDSIEQVQRFLTTQLSH